MARITLQIKNVASLVLASAASVSWGIYGRRFFDTPQKPWGVAAVCGSAFLGIQLLLLFVESKEEEELSLIRKGRLASAQHSLVENEKLSRRIQTEIESGNPESAEKWAAYRKDHYGK